MRENSPTVAPTGTAIGARNRRPCKPGRAKHHACPPFALVAAGSVCVAIHRHEEISIERRSQEICVKINYQIFL
jgi:hypothetical protein